MDKAIERYLARRGIHVTVPLDDERPFSERAPRFFKWFHESVLGLDTEEYRRAFWREAYRTGHIVGHVPHTLDDYLRRRGAAYRQDMANLLAYALLMGGAFAVWIMRRQIDKHIRRLKRPGYYEAELARRHGLARERRKLLKRSTLNPCPTDDELREAFARAKGSPADMIRFGSLLEDLECHVDNSAIFDEEGNLVGRRGGIRRYLALNVPELSARYKTVMRYKALAKRFRQALGVADPVPAAMLLPEPEMNGNPAEPAGQGKRDFASVENLKEAREEAERLLKGCEGSCVSLMAALAIRISPDYAPRDEGGMRKTADRMANARSWMAEERKRIAQARAAAANVRTG